MNKTGFIAMYMVYSLFLIFILMMLTVLLISNYKASFLNTLKNDVKEELKTQKLAQNEEILPENTENNGIWCLKMLLILFIGVIIIDRNEGRDINDKSCS